MPRLPGGVATLIERQVSMFQARQRAASAAPEPRPEQSREDLCCRPYVTISRQYGAGGSEVAEQVAESLGWSLYDRRLLEEVARDARLQERLLTPFDEQQRTDVEHWIRGLLTEETVSEHHYTRSLFRVLSSIAKVGNAVIVGRGAHLALPPEDGLRVRIYAPLAARVAKICEQDGLSAGEARRRAEQVEQTRQQWMLRAFGEKAKEKVAFDLALNPDSLDVAVCVKLIMTALEGKCGPL